MTPTKAHTLPRSQVAHFTLNAHTVDGARAASKVESAAQLLSVAPPQLFPWVANSCHMDTFLGAELAAYCFAPSRLNHLDFSEESRTEDVVKLLLFVCECATDEDATTDDNRGRLGASRDIVRDTDGYAPGPQILKPGDKGKQDGAIAHVEELVLWDVKLRDIHGLRSDRCVTYFEKAVCRRCGPKSGERQRVLPYVCISHNYLTAPTMLRGDLEKHKSSGARDAVFERRREEALASFGNMEETINKTLLLGNGYDPMEFNDGDSCISLVGELCTSCEDPFSRAVFRRMLRLPALLIIHSPTPAPRATGLQKDSMKFGRTQGRKDAEIRVCGVPYTLVAVIFHGPGHYISNLRFVDTSSTGDLLAGDDMDSKESTSGGWYHYDDMPPFPFPIPRRGELFPAAGPYVLPEARRRQHFRPTVWYYVTKHAVAERYELHESIQALRAQWAEGGFGGIYNLPPQPAAFTY